MLKVLEITINLSQPGTTAHLIEVAVSKLPNGSKFLGSSANGSSVYVFYDVPGNGGGNQSPPSQ